MPCYHPLHAVQSLTPNKMGVRSISFKRTSEVPYGYEPVDLPCGQCIGCRLERSRQWAMRCVHEASLWENNCFITLTYNDEHLPKNGSLVKDDFQRFMKRFRKLYHGLQPSIVDGEITYPIRFFHCGEYGETTQRPHYHAIVFNFDFPDKKLFKTARGVRVYTSDILAKLWGKGFCTVGDVTFESAAYVARYVLKKVNGRLAADHYEGRLPEYVTMSRCPGIASAWYEKFKHDVYPDDFIVMRGMKMKPPRFYDKRLEADSKSMFAFIKDARKAMAALHPEESTPERLAVKEIVKKAQVKYLKREL